MSLEKLINQCKQSDIKAQAKVYELFAGKLYALCLKYSKNQQDAEDVLQDSFITIFNKITQFKFKGSFEGWLKRITINTALQKYRDKSPLRVVKEEHKELADDGIVLETDVFSIDYLLSLIQQLPNRYRLVFNLYVMDNFSHKEIAEMLQISEGTSKSNLHRARAILKEKIEVYQQKQKEA